MPSRATGIAAICGRLAAWALFFLASEGLADEALERPLLLRQERLAAELIQIDSDLTCRFRVSGRETTVTHADLIRFGSWRPAARGPLLLLSDGSLLRADILALTTDKLKLGDATGFGRILWNETTLSLTHLRAVCFDPPAEELAGDQFLERISAASSRDQVWLVAGDSLSGVFLGLEAEAANGGDGPPTACRFKPEGAKEAILLPLTKVRALSFATPSKKDPSNRAKSLAVGLRDGSLVHVARAETNKQDLVLHLLGGASLSLPLTTADEESIWQQIELIQPFGGGIIYLSDLKPVSEKTVPLLTVDWPHRADRSVVGGRLRLTGNQAALKGLGQHSAGRLIYDVPTNAERFEVELAIDARAEQRGSVRFKVLLQNEAGEWSESFQSEIIRGGDSPTPVSIPLKQAQRIALLVDFAERGDECDFANWLNARFLSLP